ncbi:MAG: hypothetical protein WCA38_14805 [Candidatus Acidiferrales bacterium]
MNRFPIRAITVAIGAVILLAGKQGQPPLRPALKTQSAKPRGCTAPEYHQFDFWLGDWDAFDIDAPTKPVARAHVDPILDGCVLREDYQGTTGSEGQSFTIYDESRKVWHQTWVTNRGKLLTIEGEFKNGEMTMAGRDRVNGTERQVRGTWKPATDGVRETAVISTDGGKTWSSWFDLAFRAHKQSP